ncbi:MAG TPA: septum formation initiator family protein [Acidobacteriota bacterium]|nr:septum formation initiator family protein [Acidobacteriota bacterium]
MLSRKAKREIILIIMLAVSGHLIYSLFYSDSGYRQLQARKSELRRLQVENKQLLDEQQRYLDRIERLKNSPDEIIDVARQRQMHKPGDIVVIIPPKK